MNKLKVVTIVGTRPEIIRLSALIPKLDQFTHHVLVHTGQNSDKNLSDIFFRDMKIRKPDIYLKVDVSSMGSVIGETIKKSEELFKAVLPDAVVILGDTNSAVSALVAERLQIPVYHLEAGNRSFDTNVPEELNRKMIDHISSFNLPYNNYSWSNLIAEGIHPRRMSKTGSPMREVLNLNLSSITNSTVLEKLGLSRSNYFVASFHRQENVDNSVRLTSLIRNLNQLVEKFGLPIIVSTHPRTLRRLSELGIEAPELMQFRDPFGFHDYCQLQLNSACVLSDSGTLSEEASILHFRAISLRDSTERPEGLEVGAIRLFDPESGDLSSIVQMCLDSDISNASPDGYEVDDFSDRVINFISSTARLHKRWAGIRSLDLF